MASLLKQNWFICSVHYNTPGDTGEHIYKPGHEQTCFLQMRKTKAQISCAITMQLIIYGCGGHLGHATCTIYKYFLSAFPRRLRIKFALIGKAVLEKKIFENGTHIHVYTCSPGAGQTTPWDHFICIKTIIQSIESFAASFSPINYSNI